jgi:hypothetical protein
LQAIVSEKLELDVHRSLQRVPRTWVLFHAIPSLLLMGVLLTHIVAVLLF